MHIVPTWEGLKIIGSSKVVGFTALIPFIGYLLLFNENLINYISISEHVIGYKVALKESISRLYYLYFGLSFLGLSSIAFAFFCPVEIKGITSEYEYLEKEVNVMTYERLKQLTNSYQSKLIPESSLYEELSNYVSEYKNSGQIATNAYWNNESRKVEYEKEIKNSAILNILKFNWFFKNHSNEKIRASVALGYITGFTLVAIPSVTVSIKIILSLVSKFIE